ncbi:MAG TPA: translocation/assembly module TamB domain-containing protein [Flavobacterium sp.]
MKKYFRKAGKVILWIVGIVLGLFLLIVIALQIPPVQQFVKNKAVTYLEGKIKTKVAIDRIEIGLPKKIILEGVYFEDQKKDTLLAGKKLAVNISLFELINNKVEINSVELEGIVANINRNKQAQFNFDYIIKAFASDKPKDTTGTPMEFTINKIALDKIKIKYNDAITKNNIDLNLNHLDTKIKTFDLQKMKFSIPNFTIDGLQLLLDQGLVATSNVPDQKKPAAGPDIQLALGTINLSQIKLNYSNEASRLKTAVALQKLSVDVNQIDLKNQILDFKTIQLSGTKAVLDIGKEDTREMATVAGSKTKSKGWNVKINDASFDRVNFAFNDQNATPVQKGMDYKHLGLTNLTLKANTINYSAETISGNIDGLSVNDKSGLEIESLKTAFFYGQKGASLRKLYLKTPQTLIQDEINITYPSLASLSKNPGAIGIDAHLDNSTLGFKDILLFVPTLSKSNPFKDNPYAILLINSTISGKLDNLYIPNLEISGLGTTKVSASGRITGLPDVKTAYFDFNIRNLQSGSKDLNGFLPKNTIPNTIQLPANFATTGTFKGTINNFDTDLNLVSSYGNAAVKANFDKSLKNREKYNLDAALDNFDVGKLIKNPSVGKITLKTNVKGTGLNPKTARATVAAHVASANFNKYTYRNLIVKGNIGNGLFSAKADIKDPNLKFDLVTSGSFKDKYPKGKLRFNVDIADLNKLNLHAGPMKIRGTVDADIQSANLDYLNGKIMVHNLTIANAKEQFVTDTISIVAIATAEKNSVTLDSQFADATITGKYKLSAIGTSLKSSISKYYNLNPNLKKVKIHPQQLAFTINVHNDPSLTRLVPQLTSIEPIAISGRYNTQNDSIVLSGSIPRLIYGKNTISNAVIKVDTQDNALVYSLVVDDIRNEQLQLPYTSIAGTVADNKVDYTLQLKDLKNEERYLIAGNLTSAGGNTEIRLNPENLKLDYEPWAIAAENLIRLGKKGIYANNFALTKGQNSISLQSQSESANAPLSVDFKTFEIKTLTNIVQKKNLEINGTINGNTVIENLTSSPRFIADLTIDNFAFQKDTLGNVSIKVNNETANTYAAQVAITGQDNDVKLNGNYKTGNSTLDMNLNIQKLNLKSIQGFTMNNLAESTGFLSGNLKISGKASQPVIIGDLNFNDIGFTVTKLNARFKSITEKIAFTTNGILLNDFNISDDRDNQLTINGKINNKDLTNPGFNLTLDAKNFNAMNSKASDNPNYYGELYLDNALSIKGDLNKPIVEGTIKINKDTKMTIVLPQSDPSLEDREGIVEFIDQDQPKLITTVKGDADANTEIKGINASVNIEIDKEAELSMIIDKANGDFLSLKGEANLTAGIDASGKTTLTGRYEFSEGGYQMSFNLIKRKFDIKPGSYILWTGDPMKADVNITAIYKKDVAPIDLIADQLAAMPAEARNTYKQKIPFETELKMKGELLKPEISFDIVLPEGNNNVATAIIDATQTKLQQLRQQPSELNKQVFALLLMGRFIGEDPFSSEAGSTSGESIARASASRILSQQLNNLAGDLIKGVELEFDLQSSEDYTSGQKQNRTDLNVGLSKTLLNDRLKVTVGSNFGLEGAQQANQEANNIAGDISADYMLSKDGRYKLRAYRKNQYQVALQGQVVETGVAFTITINYNKFRELFHRSKNENQSKKSKKKPNE